MKGLILEAKNKVIWTDLKKPTIKSPFDAIARPLAVAPCTSDVHTIETVAMPEVLGTRLGHEGVGVVEEVGDKVKDFKVGDRVILPTEPIMWRTLEAQEGMGKMRLQDPYTGDDPDYGGFFADYTLVYDADMNLAHIPDNVSLEQAAMVPDVVATGFSTVEATDIRFGDTVLILGIGPIGLMALNGSILKGAARTIVVGSRPVTFELAKKLGATDCINYKDGDIIKQVFDLTGGKPVDKVIIASGGDASASFSTALTLVKYGGIVSCLTAFLADETVSLPNAQWWYGSTDKTIKTVRAEGGRAYMDRLLALVSTGRIDPSILVSHKFHGMEKVIEALELMGTRDQTVVKPVVFAE